MTPSNLTVTETSLSNLKCDAAIHCMSVTATQQGKVVKNDVAVIAEKSRPKVECMSSYLVTEPDRPTINHFINGLLKTTELVGHKVDGLHS